MIRRFAAVAVALSIALIIGQAPLGAGDKGKDKGKGAEKISTFDQLLMANQLVELGRSNKQPELLIAAASLLRGLVSGPELKLEKAAAIEFDKDATEKAEPEPVKAKKFTDLSDELLDQAKEMAEGDKDVLGMIKKVRTDTRGAVEGPRSLLRAVPARGTDVLHIAFNGGHPGRVAIHTNGHMARMSLHVAKGGLVAEDTCITGSATFYPPKTATYVVRVHNPHNFQIQYRLFTN